MQRLCQGMLTSQPIHSLFAHYGRIDRWWQFSEDERKAVMEKLRACATAAGHRFVVGCAA
jgi:hypothetical protein